MYESSHEKQWNEPQQRHSQCVSIGSRSQLLTMTSFTYGIATLITPSAKERTRSLTSIETTYRLLILITFPCISCGTAATANLDVSSSSSIDLVFLCQIADRSNLGVSPQKPKHHLRVFEALPITDFIAFPE